MKIFIIHAHYQHRGGEDVVVDHEIELLRQKHDVKVYFTNNHKGFKGALQTFLSPFNFIESAKIQSEILDFNPDIVHIHNTHYSIGPLIIRTINRMKIPIVMTLHNYRLLCPTAILAHNNHIYLKSLEEDFPWSAVKDKVHNNSFIKTFWLAWTYWIHKKWGTFNKVNLFFVFSEFAKNNFLKSNIRIPENKFIIKPNSVSTHHINASTKDSHFFYLGRLSEEKGIIPLIKGLINTDIPLKIAGDGPQKNEVLNLIKDQKNITYLGNLSPNKVYEELAKSTALVLPSVCFEGMPLSVLEAFSQGVVAITSDLGVFKNIIHEGVNGYRFDPNNIQDIQSTLRTWMHLQDDEKNIMQKNAFNEYIEKYTDEINLEILTDTYNDVLTSSKL